MLGDHYHENFARAGGVALPLDWNLTAGGLLLLLNGGGCHDQAFVDDLAAVTGSSDLNYAVHSMQCMLKKLARYCLMETGLKVNPNKSRVGNLNCDINCLNENFDRSIIDTATELNMVKTFNRNKRSKPWENEAYKQSGDKMLEKFQASKREDFTESTLREYESANKKKILKLTEKDQRHLYVSDIVYRITGLKNSKYFWDDISYFRIKKISSTSPISLVAWTAHFEALYSQHAN